MKTLLIAAALTLTACGQDFDTSVPDCNYMQVDLYNPDCIPTKESVRWVI